MQPSKPSSSTHAPKYVLCGVSIVGARLTSSLRRFLPTLPSISTNSAPILPLRSTGRPGSPSPTKTETAPLPPTLLSRTVTRFLGEPAVLPTVKALCPYRLPLLLPYLPTHPPVFLAAAESPRRLLPARARLAAPSRLKLVAPRATTRMVVSSSLFQRLSSLWLASPPCSYRILMFRQSLAMTNELYPLPIPAFGNSLLTSFHQVTHLSS